MWFITWSGRLFSYLFIRSSELFKLNYQTSLLNSHYYSVGDQRQPLPFKQYSFNILTSFGHYLSTHTSNRRVDLIRSLGLIYINLVPLLGGSAVYSAEQNLFKQYITGSDNRRWNNSRYVWLFAKPFKNLEMQKKMKRKMNRKSDICLGSQFDMIPFFSNTKYECRADIWLCSIVSFSDNGKRIGFRKKVFFL